MIRVVNHRPVGIYTFSKYILCNFVYLIDPDICLFVMQNLLPGWLKFIFSSCKYVTVAYSQAWIESFKWATEDCHFSLMRFLTQNLEFYTSNSTIHNYNIRSRIQLHKPSATLALYQKGPYYVSIRIFNALPHNIAELILQKKGFLTYLLTYLLTPWSRVLLEKLTSKLCS